MNAMRCLSGPVPWCYHAAVKGAVVVIAAIAAAALAAGPVGATSPAAVAANEAGGRLFRSGAVPEAIAQFEAALALEPGYHPARQNLATALAAQGSAELRAGILDGARTHLERAAELAPDDAAVQLLLGVLQFRRGDFFEARRHVDRALEMAPEHAEAREISGDLYYQQGSLELARSEWDLALKSAGNRGDVLRAKLGRASREMSAEGGFRRDVSRHFTLQHDGPVPREVARAALLILEQAYDRLWRDFGRSPRHDILVILYARDLFDEITRSPGWVGGVFDGKIRVPVGGLKTEGDARRLAPVLAHELTHAFIRANVASRLPPWFEEGLAGHFEDIDPEAAMQTARAAGGFSSLAEVDAALAGGARVAAAYAAALLAVEDLIRREGFWLPSRILDHVASGRSFPEAFRDAAGVSLEEFEADWVRAQR